MRGLLLAGAVVVVGCGGGDDESTPVPLMVLEVTPADGAIEVELDAAVSVVFNQAIDPASADGQITVEGIGGALTADHNVVTLAPEAPFDYLTDYSVVVGTGVVGLADGDTLDQTQRYQFTSRARRWSSPSQISSAVAVNVPIAASPRLAAGAEGRVVAIWQSATAGDDVRLQWSAYDPATDVWSDANEIAASSREMEPQLSSDDAGEVLVAWTELTAVRIAWIDPASGSVEVPPAVYSAPEAAPPRDLALAMSRSGNAALAFVGAEGIAVSRHAAGAGDWSAAEVLGSANAYRTAVAVADDGSVTAAWSHYDGVLEARWFDREAWRDAATLDGDGGIDRVRLQSLPSGGAIAAWGVPAADGGEVHVRWLDSADGSWGDDTLLATTLTPAETWPELAVTPGGDVLLTWNDWNYALYGRWFRGEGWEEPVTITPSNAFGHPTALDSEGNAITAYHEGNASYYLAVRDEWIASHHGLDDFGGLAVAFSRSDPVAISGADDKIRVSIYR